LTASPRYFPRVPLASPFWNHATYNTILRCVASAHIIHGPDLEQLTVTIEQTLKVAGALLCGSGSLALELALRACGIRSGDEVIVPSFCCNTVVPPILACGATPVLADIGAQLNLTDETVDAAITRNTKAIIVPHLFGNPADIQSIVSSAQPRRIAVIDDAAQALGATIDGQPAGSFGDFGILSFGAGKVCAGIGGVLITRKAGDGVSLAPSSTITVLAQLFSTLLWGCWRRWTLPVEPLLRRRPSPHEPPAAYRHERMANLQAAVIEALLQTLNENIAARRARVALYRELLGDFPAVELIAHRPGSACLTQVIRVARAGHKDDPAPHLIGALAGAGFEAQGSYVPIHHLAELPHCVWDRLPKTERVWADLIELPCEPSVSLGDVERIAAIVKQFAQSRPN
jgi:dTDP-4-amino-4,6-dideoxygalactose transaminase